MGYTFDRANPRAPTQAEWDAMDELERERVCTTLPSELPEETRAGGDRHRLPKTRALEALREFYRKKDGDVYLTSRLPVYYPGEKVFAPDVMVVAGAEDHPREHWVVSKEGKGPSFVLEVVVSGDDKNQVDKTLELYARVGIPEVFVFDGHALHLFGYHLPEGADRYEQVQPSSGHWESQALGLELAIEDARVRFYYESTPLPEAREAIEALEKQLKTLDERSAKTESRFRAAEAKVKEEATRIDRLCQRLREMGVDPTKV